MITVAATAAPNSTAEKGTAIENRADITDAMSVAASRFHEDLVISANSDAMTVSPENAAQTAPNADDGA
jgi:hypothetical protein